MTSSKTNKNKNILIFKYIDKILNEYVFFSIFILILIAVSFSKVFTINSFTYFSSDISEYYFPLFVFINQKLRLMTLPIQNEFYLMGQTSFAARGDTSVFYPILWLFHLLIDAKNNLNIAYYAYFLHQILHYFLGGLFFYLFVRKGLALKKWGSLFASTVYIFSGSFMARNVHPPLQYLLVWYPLLFLFFLLLLKKRKIIYAILDAFIVAIIIVSGHPQIVYYYSIFFLLVILSLIITEKTDNKLHLFSLSISIFIIGALLSLVQLLPAIELSFFSARLSPETTIKNLYNSLHPLYYLTLLVPKLYGKHQSGFWGTEYPWGNWENYIYVGVIAIILSFFSIWWENRRLLVIFYFSLILSFVVSLGRYWGVSKFINQNIPLSDGLSWVGRISMVFHFFAVTLVGIGAHVFFEKKITNGQFIKTIVVISAVGAFIIFMNFNKDFVYHLQPAGRMPPTMEAFSSALNDLNRSVFLYIISVCSILTYWIYRKKIYIYIIVGILLIDIIPIGQEFNPLEKSYGSPEGMYREYSQLQIIKKDTSLFRVDGLSPRNVGMINGVQTVGGYATTSTIAYQQIIPYINLKYPSILDMVNIKYLVTAENNLPADRYIKLDQYLWRNNKVLPRVFFIGKYKYISNSQEMIKNLTSPNFNPKEEVLLDRKNVSIDIRPESENNNYIPEEVKIDSYNPDDIKVSINSYKDGFLFLGELQYPGWLAFVDGKRRDLIKANVSFYALPIEKGQHRVNFRFVSLSHYIGIATSILTLFLLLILLINKRTRKYIFKQNYF